MSSVQHEITVTKVKTTLPVCWRTRRADYSKLAKTRWPECEHTWRNGRYAIYHERIAWLFDNADDALDALHSPRFTGSAVRVVAL